jgi:hypothetical protein
MQKTVDALSATPSILLPAGASRTHGTVALTLHDVPVLQSTTQIGEYTRDSDAQRPLSPTATHCDEDSEYGAVHAHAGTANALAAWGD